MDFATATDRVLLGESLGDVERAYREQLCRDVGLDPEEVDPGTFRREARRFMCQLCRHLGDRHAGDWRAGHALLEWVRVVDEYEAFDALLSSYRFEGRRTVVERGRRLFPGPLTAHWPSDEDGMSHSSGWRR